MTWTQFAEIYRRGNGQAKGEWFLYRPSALVGAQFYRKRPLDHLIDLAENKALRVKQRTQHRTRGR